ncbi:MAG TPA: hypothetical protein V6C86_03480 [Oculatellaceae cyanobacterium]
MPPFNFEAEARNLAINLDRGQGNEVAARLQQDSQYLGPQGYSALLKMVSRYEQKNVGDDLIIVDNGNGTREALIKRQALDVGTIIPEPPPPPPAAYYQPQPYYTEAPPPPRNNVGCNVASVGIGAVLGNVIAGRHDKGVGTAAGAIAGAVVGSENCNR